MLVLKRKFGKEIVVLTLCQRITWALRSCRGAMPSSQRYSAFVGPAGVPTRLLTTALAIAR